MVLAPDGVLLLKNDRDEWELPGGRLEPDESPRECVKREVQEETSLKVEVGPLLDAWVFEVVEGKRVFVVAYGCRVDGFDGVKPSEEHAETRSFPLDGLEDVPLPEGYRNAIRQWSNAESGPA